MQNNDYSRKMEGNTFSGSFQGNTTFQSDHNTQTYQTSLDGTTQELFAKLVEEIKSTITDPEERDDNIADLEKIKEAAANGNKERAAKFFGRLGKGIQISSAAVALAKNLGILALLA